MKEDLLEPMNKKRRYILGLAFLIIYIISQIISSQILRYNTNFINKPFSYSYLYYTFCSIFIILSIIREKLLTKRFKQKQLKYYYHTFFNFYNSCRDSLNIIPDYMIHYNEEEFNKKFHKIALVLGYLLYFSTSFLFLAIEKDRVKSINSIYIITSLIFVIVFRKIILNKGINMYYIISFIIFLIGILFIFLFQMDLFFSKTDIVKSLIFSIIAGILLALFVIMVKHYHTKYRFTFDMYLVYGFIGLYIAISIPLLLSILTIFKIEEFEFPEYNDLIYLIVFSIIDCIFRGMMQNYSIIYLSPIIFIFGLTLTIPLNCFIDIFSTGGNIDVFFILGIIFLLLGFIALFLEKWVRIKKSNYDLKKFRSGVNLNQK